jgi:hypothetical protein
MVNLFNWNNRTLEEQRRQCAAGVPDHEKLLEGIHHLPRTQPGSAGTSLPAYEIVGSDRPRPDIPKEIRDPSLREVNQAVQGDPQDQQLDPNLPNPYIV